MNRRIFAILGAFLMTATLLPLLAPPASAENYGEWASITPGNTYYFYKATGGTRSSTLTPLYDAHWHTSLPSEPYAHPNMAEAVTNGVGSYTAWAEVWKTVKPTQEGDFYTSMKGWFIASLCALGGDLFVQVRVNDLSTGATIVTWSVVHSMTAAYIPHSFDQEFWVGGTWHGLQNHMYGIVLRVYASSNNGIVDCMLGERGAWWTEILVRPPSTGGGGGCLLEGTEIAMADGTTMPIEKVKDGMAVLGYDLETGQLVPEIVVTTAKEKVSVMVDVNCGGLVLTPRDQPIYVRNGTWTGWVTDPENLDVGMELFCPLDESWIPIFSVGFLTGKFKVYDLGMTSPDNYIANGFLCDIKKK